MLHNISTQIGGAVSLAIVAAVLSAAETSLMPGERLPNMAPANRIIAAIAVIGVVFKIRHHWHKTRSTRHHVL